MTSAEVTTTIGFFLTLVGLIGTFFYVHLSTWLREMLELAGKADLNSAGDTEDRRRGRTECRFQIKKLLNHVPLLMSVVISGFIALVTNLAKQLMGSVQPRPEIFDFYRTAGRAFLGTYLILTLYFLAHGYLVGFRIRKQLKAP